MIHTTAKTNVILEENQPLSQSYLWQLQRNFFTQQGTVPHYITSNPYIASTYSKLVSCLSSWGRTNL